MSEHDPKSAGDAEETPSPASADEPRSAGHSVTLLLEDARKGGEEAMDALVVAVYRELRRTAQYMMSREAAGHTLLATDLVHEAFLRLFAGEDISFENRRHFFGSAAMVMRRVLIDHARRKRSGKRIPKESIVPIEAAHDLLDLPNVDMLALDQALDALEARNPRQAKIVELRFFAGLTETEVAELLEVSRMTISRDWKVARLRLLREMEG